MRKFITIIIILCAGLVFSVPSDAANASAKLKEAWLKMPPEKLMQTANHYMLDLHRPDSALLFHTLLTEKIGEGKGLTKEERSYLCRSYNDMANIFMFHYYDFSNALDNLMKARKYCDEPRFMAVINYNFGNIYSFYALCYPTKENIKKSHDFARLAFEQAMNVKKWDTAIGAFMSLWDFGFDSWTIGEYEKELKRFSKIPVLYTDSQYVSDRLTYEAILLLQKHQYQAAINKFRQQLVLSKSRFNPERGYALALWNIIQTYSIMGKRDSVMVNAQRLLDFARANGLKDINMEACRILMKNYREMGDQARSNEFELAFYRERDSLMVTHQLGTVDRSYLLNDLQDVKRQVGDLKQKQLIDRIIVVAVLAGIILSLIFLFIIMRKNRRLRERNRALYENSRQMIADDREQQRARLQLEEKIANLEQQIQEKKDEVRLKYQNSRLNDDDKLRLQMAIRHGMENIDEVCKDDFSIDRLAEMCGENSKKISQVVNETYGCSFSTLLRHIRCKEACRRMDDHDNFGRYTIEAIGESVGFKSRTGFIRAFKNCIGLLPSEYMKLSHEQQ